MQMQDISRYILYLPGEFLHDCSARLYLAAGHTVFKQPRELACSPEDNEKVKTVP